MEILGNMKSEAPKKSRKITDEQILALEAFEEMRTDSFQRKKYGTQLHKMTGWGFYDGEESIRMSDKELKSLIKQTLEELNSPGSQSFAEDIVELFRL